MENTLDILSLLIMTFILFLGGAIQGSLGYGLGLFCVPFLVLVDPRLAPAPLIAATLAFNIAVTMREKIALDFFGLKWITLGSVPGTYLGALLLAYISLNTASLLIGIIVIIGVLLSVIGLRLPIKKGLLFLVGVLSGGMATISSIGGPPVALVYQDEPGGKLRATLAGYFIVLAILSVISVVAVGKFGVWEIKHALLMIPGMMLGYLLSNRIIKFLTQQQIRTGILLLSAVSGAIVIFKQLM